MSKYIPRGEMTPEQLERVRRKGKYYMHMSQLGHRFRCEGEELERVVRKLRWLHSHGMSAGDIHVQTGVAEMTLRAIARGERTWIAQRVQIALMKAVPEVRDGAMRVAFFPTQRRVRALFADGFTYTYMGEPIGWKANMLWRIANGYGYSGGSFDSKQYVYLRTAITVAELYDKLAGTDPLGHGVPPKQITYARRRAHALGYAPSHTWDPDTIVDPHGFPEWTGMCGTCAGYRIHYRQHILPVCVPCQEAKNAQERGRRAG